MQWGPAVWDEVHRRAAGFDPYGTQVDPMRLNEFHFETRDKCSQCDSREELKECACGKARYCSPKCQEEFMVHHAESCGESRMDFVQRVTIVPYIAGYSDMDHILRGTPQCEHCRRYDDNLLECACNSARYCDEECQRRDWMTHKEECKAARRANQERSSL